MKESISRKIDHPITSLLAQRWSPRSMTGEPLPHDELLSLFEAARWAPSSYNNQPWVFLYAQRDTEHWDLFFNLLVEFNQSWTKNAAALVVVVSRKNFYHNEKPCPTHSFDTGAAWMSLAIEATSRGLVAHGMAGFDYEKARKDLEIPDDYQVEAMIAIGKQAPKEKLPPALQEKEAPAPRKSLKEFLRNGKFSG